MSADTHPDIILGKKCGASKSSLCWKSKLPEASGSEPARPLSKITTGTTMKRMTCALEPTDSAMVRTSSITTTAAIDFYNGYIYTVTEALSIT